MTRDAWCSLHYRVLFLDPPRSDAAIAAVVAGSLQDPRVGGMSVVAAIKVIGCPACFVRPELAREALATYIGNGGNNGNGEEGV